MKKKSKIKNNTLEILIRYNKVILEICEGQAYDMEFENRNATIDEYLLMSEKKTGALFALCFEMPALINKDFSDYKSILRALGKNLGIIFQMQDDILEFSTSEENMGKGTDSDIARKKKTILSSIAYEHNQENWLQLQNDIKSMSVVQKKQVLKDYFKENSILDQANDLLDIYKKKCKEMVNSLPEDTHKDIMLILDLVIKRSK